MIEKTRATRQYKQTRSNLYAIMIVMQIICIILITWIIFAGTIIPYMAVLHGLRSLSASTSSVIGMLEPILAGVFAWFWLGETFRIIQLIGGVVVIAGIITADRARLKVY